jgi:nucleotide-binding universal stress UspA family protein
VAKKIVIAVDAKERTLDAVALGRLLTEATHTRAVLVTVFPHSHLLRVDEPELVRERDEARATLVELGESEGLDLADAMVVPGVSAARELHRLSEQPGTGVIVVGSTTRGPVGRLVVGGVGERLLAGAACPVAVAPRGFGDRSPAALARIGVGFDGSPEARGALDAALALARSSGARVRLITAADPPRADLQAAHDQALADLQGTVEAEGRFADGPAASVLAAESAEVDLLVVGSRTYGPLGAVLLGSTGGALAHTATCPLLVTPRGVRFDLEVTA